MSANVKNNNVDGKMLNQKGGWKRILRPELATLIIMIVVFIVCANLSPFFLDLEFLLDTTTIYIEFGLIALIFTMVVIAGHIDLSVGSMIAMASVVMGKIFNQAGSMSSVKIVTGNETGGGGDPNTLLIIGIIAAIAVGILGGWFNGFLVTKLQLPALICTIGTMSLYRGIAQVLLGDQSASGFPQWFVGVNGAKIADYFPWVLVAFIVLAIVCAIVMSKTTMGRRIVAIGANPTASEYSAIPVKKYTIALFILSGLISAIGGIMMSSRLYVARYDVAMGAEMEILLIVLLGGTDINGGRGTILGTVLAFFTIIFIKIGMNVANIKSEFQLVITGALLILALLIPQLFDKLTGASKRS